MNASIINIQDIKSRRGFEALNTRIPQQAIRPSKPGSSGIIIRVMICFILSFYASNSFAQLKDKQEKKNVNTTIGFKPKGELSNSDNNALPNKKDQKRDASEKKPINSNSMLDQHADTPQLDYDQLPSELKQKVNSNKANGLPLLEGINKVYRVEIKQCTDESECNKKLEFMLREHDFISLSFREINLVDLRVSPSMKSEELKSLLLSEGLTFNIIQEFYTLGAKN